MKNQILIQALLLGQEKVQTQYTISYGDNNIVASGAILESQWFGDEPLDSSRVSTHNYQRGSDVGWIKKISLYNNESYPLFWLSTLSTPQCTHEADVVDVFSATGSAYADEFGEPHEREFDTCVHGITVYTKFAAGYGGTPYEGGDFDAFGTNYISDIRFHGYDGRLTYEGGEQSEWIDFGAGCLVGISA